MKSYYKKPQMFYFLTVFLLSSILLLSSVSVSQRTDEFDVRSIERTNSLSTHTVLVEIASSQGCGGCHDWNEEIIAVYENGSFDFEFVEMIVYDLEWNLLNLDAFLWKEIHGIFNYPTSVFDGGFKILQGSNPSNLAEILSSCETREVNDIDAELNVFWLSSSLLNISVEITNNEPETYNGSFKVPITEMISRYNTSYQEPFHNGFLDYAFNKNISIAPGETVTDYVLWDGKDHQDAHEDDFSDIQQQNMKLLLSVFDSRGYCDETVTWTVQMDLNQSMYDRGFPIRHAVDGDWAGAQDIIPVKNVLSSVDIYLRKFGDPEFNLTVELREESPEGSLLDMVSFAPDEIASSWEWLSVDVHDLVIDQNKSYFIVLPPAPSGVTTSFGYEWGYAFGNQYDDGSFWFTRDGGILWRDLPSMYEFVFRTYGYN